MAGKENFFALRPDEQWVDELQRERAFEIALLHPNVRCALGMIADDLTKNGLLFLQQRQVLSLSFDFEEHIKKHWIPCMRDAIISIAAQGVLPLHTYINKEGERLTCVPQYETYKLSIRYSQGQPIIRFWWKHTDYNRAIPFEYYADPSVEVLTGFGYDPRRSGALTSVIAGLFTAVDFMDDMLSSATTAEKQNAAPPLVVAPPLPKEANLESQDAAVGYGLFVNCDPVEVREDEKYDGMDLYARLGSKQVTAEVQALSREKWKMGIAEQQEVVTASLMNRITLQPGQSVAHQQLPRPRGDLVPLINISKATVSEVFKIPQELLSGSLSGRTAEGTANLLLRQYQNTLGTWARILEPIITAMYRRQYEAEDKRELAQLVGKHLPALMPELLPSLAQIRVIVNFAQDISREELEYGVNRGILDYRIMARIWLMQHGLPKELLAHTEDLLSDQLKKQVLLSQLGLKQQPAGQRASNSNRERAEKEDEDSSGKKKEEKEKQKKRNREEKEEEGKEKERDGKEEKEKRASRKQKQEEDSGSKKRQKR